MKSVRKSPEFQFLLAACRASPGYETAEIQAACSALDSELLLRHSKKHGVRPHLIRTFDACSWVGIHDATREALEQFRTFAAIRNAVLADELAELTQALASAGIRSATFKGPCLAESLYGGLAEREFEDLDVFIAERDRLGTEEVLARRGYVTYGHRDGYRHYLEASGQFMFRQMEKRIKVDLHWTFAPFKAPFPFDPADIWNRLQTVRVGGRDVPALSWVHHALLLASHGLKERWRSLKWVCDFDRVLRVHPELQWRQLLNQAQNRGCGRAVLTATVLASRLLGAPADPSVLAAGEKDPGTRRIVGTSCARLSTLHAPSEQSEFLYGLQARERLRDKLYLSYALATTLTPSDYATPGNFYGSTAWKYIARPFRLSRKAGRLISQSLASRLRPGRGDLPERRP